MDRIAAAIGATPFGEVVLLMHEGEVRRIDTRIRTVAWCRNNALDNHTVSSNTVR